MINKIGSNVKSNTLHIVSSMVKLPVFTRLNHTQVYFQKDVIETYCVARMLGTGILVLYKVKH